MASLLQPIVQVIDTTPWGPLQRDLQNFDLIGDSIRQVEHPYHLKYIMTESHDMDVLRHQLMVLKGEYPRVLFGEALDSWGGLFENGSVVENVTSSSSVTPLVCAQFIPLLLELVELEHRSSLSYLHLFL